MSNTTLIRSNSSAFTSFKNFSEESVDTEDKKQHTPDQSIHPVQQVQHTRKTAFQNIRKMFNLPTLSCSTK